MEFNPNAPMVMHVDVNSCFATIEQQANPFLRGKPVVVAAYNSPRGVVLAASYEAKKFGVGTGSLVGEVRKIIPSLVVLDSDPEKYRFVHLQMRKILSAYTNKFFPKSIDEFVLFLGGMPILRARSVLEIGDEIKERIKKEIGEVITVSIGISTNRVLAKLASNLKKPDGLEVIDKTNFEKVYDKICLRDLPGINKRNEARLNVSGINSVGEFWEAPLWRLRGAFRSVLSEYWYVWLRGWEVGDGRVQRRSFGNSYSLPRHGGSLEEIKPVLMKLCTKTVSRMRRHGLGARGVHVGVRFKSGEGWHKGYKLQRIMFETQDVYFESVKILTQCPLWPRPVHTLFVTCFELISLKDLQLSVFADLDRRRKLVAAIDHLNNVWGDFSVVHARMMKSLDKVPDRIGFGNVGELW